MTSDLAGLWLKPLAGSLAELNPADWRELAGFAKDLTTSTRQQRQRHDVPRARRLLAVRESMAQAGHLGQAVPDGAGGAGRPVAVAVLQQFICGYADLDLRDTCGLGHGRLIAQHGGPHLRGRWLPRLLAGELAGIAVTEAHGGSRARHTTTCAVADGPGRWTLTGTKTWISRLAEAAVFLVFFRLPDGRLAAAAVDADRPGLVRRPLEPAGLSGWSWGILELCDVPITVDDLLGPEGTDAWPLFTDHFAFFRPLVTATALGSAAAVIDTVAAALATRRDAVGLSIRDNALITLGRGYGQINAALLAVINAVRLADAGHPHASAWSCAAKAHGVDVAHNLITTAALLVGASSFRAHSHLDKTRRDVTGLLLADGVHDSLYRAAGQHLVHPRQPAEPFLPHVITQEPVDV